MRFLGLVMAHNAETVLGKALQNLSLYCDAVYVLNDRSSDETFSIARHFPIVQNIFSIDPSLPAEEWYFPEGQLLQLLYNMAEFYQPDWIIRLDADECVEGWADLRSYLDSLPPHVSGVQCPKVSGWADREYPQKVALM